MTKNTKSKPKTEHILYLHYDEYINGGDIVEGDEYSDWPSYETEYIDWHLEKCTISKWTNFYDMLHQEELEVDFKPKIGSEVFVVYVRYGSGGTFSYTCGYWEILGLFDCVEKAEKVKKSIDEDVANSRFWRGNFDECTIQSLVIDE